MSPLDLAAMFNLGADPNQGAPSVLTEDNSVLSTYTATAILPASPTALKLDSWSLRKGAEWNLQADGVTPIEAFTAADIRAAYYDPDPRLYAGPCDNPLRQEFIKSLLESEDYKLAHDDTNLNETMTRAAFDVTVKQWQDLEDSRKKDATAKEPKTTPKDLLDAARAGGRAAKDAKLMADDLAELGRTFGPADPKTGVKMDPSRLAALYKKIKGDPKIKRVTTMLGRLTLVARAAQKRKTIHGADDMVGVTTGGDIHRLVPGELCYLAGDPELELLELDTLRRLAEKTALVREWSATEPVGKGPIVITVDESGSMEGSKEETAKALALAIAGIARQQRRWCGLIAYSGNSGHRLLALPPGQWDELAVLEWIQDFIGGGCQRDVPIVELPDFWKQLGPPAKKTDIVMITDAEVTFSQKELDDFIAWKQSVTAKVTGLIIEDAPGDLAKVCDTVYTVPAITVESEDITKLLGV